MIDDEENQRPQVSGNSQSGQPTAVGPKMSEEQIKQLAKVVCICKGIKLGRVLRAIEACSAERNGECPSIADVNAKAGTGSGGCQGQRCGPRIKFLLQKFSERS